MLDQPFKLFSLLRDQVRDAIFILGTRCCSGLFNQLPEVVTNDRDAMSAVRGGIAHVTLPGGGNTLPGLPTLPASWPGAAALLKELHIPVPLQIAPQPATQDPRLL